MRSFSVDLKFSSDLELSPDGSRILIADGGFGVHLIDAQSGKELLVLPINGLRSAKFDRDGKKIIAVDGYGVRVLDGTPLPESKK